MRSYSVRSLRGILLICAMFALIFLPAAGLHNGVEVAAAKEAKGEKSSKAEETAKEMIHIGQWLLLGPLPSPLPAFNDEGESKVGAEELLGYGQLPLKGLTPIKGAKVNSMGDAVAWTMTAADTGGVSIPADTTMPWVAYLAAYVEVPRWMKVDVAARGTNPYELTIDGSSVVKQTSAAKMKDDPKKGDVKLVKGKHLVLVKTVFTTPGAEDQDDSEKTKPKESKAKVKDKDDARDDQDSAAKVIEWRFDLKVSAAKDFDTEPVLSTDPSRIMNMGDVLDVATIDRVELSPDGSHYAVWISERVPPEGGSEGRIEIRRFRDNVLVKTLKDMDHAGQWNWAPSGNRLSYVTTDDEKGTLRIVDLDTGGIETVVENVEHLGGYSWSPDGSYIAYSVDHKYKPDESGVKRLLGPYDRRHYERDKSFLHLTSVPGGITRELTAGEHTTSIYDIHPNAETMLIGRYYEDLTDRPYSVTEVSLLDVKSQEAEELHKGPWITGALWSPDGNRILVLGGPSAFGPVGRNVPEGVIPNEYDTQAYIFDPDTKKVDPITREFDPSIQAAYWPKPGDHIYFVVEETEYVELYRYNVRRRTFTRIDLPCDVIHSASVARDRALAMCTGSSATEPVKLYAVDLTSGRVRTVLDPAAERFEHVRIGKVETWNFTAANGKEIAGRVHYPPDFDPAKTYPCIVYYYGGTSPVGRSFGGRYPKDLWASMGYIVYVLQPSGATGFGQEFSAEHVNDWGKTTTAEIIDGVGNFLKAHPFVDPERVGCIGASYGGFMTQLLVTKTDIFAAAVSHAGISALTSYWGEGYWGYEYSADATANSFPWNRQDIYVGHSPIYAADKINTPLLLLHGDSDTNVPPGESEQMYTALKLLGREVEYIRVLGEDHWVVDYKKRIAWSNAIMSWFDKWLKDEPEWWDDMYPPIKKAGEEGADEGAGGAKGAAGVKGGAKTSTVTGKGRDATQQKAEVGAEQGTEELAEQVEALRASRPMKMSATRVELEKYGTVLFGEVTREDIARHLPDWNLEYFDYAPDQRLKADLAKYLKDVQITCVIGTWCSDCRREIPRLWRILEEVGYPVSKMKMLAVGSSKFTRDMPIPPEVFEWSDTVKKHYGVESVATIMFRRGGVELGRIVESPEITLEEDILKIVRHQ